MSRKYLSNLISRSIIKRSNIAESYFHWLKTKLKFENSIITDQFEGHFLVEIVCSNCQFETFNFETFAELNLDLPNHCENLVNLKEMRKKYIKSTSLGEERRKSEVFEQESINRRVSRRNPSQMKEFMRKNSSVFELEDSIYNNKNFQNLKNNSKILNRKKFFNDEKEHNNKEKTSSKSDNSLNEIEENIDINKDVKKKKKDKTPVLLTDLIDMFFSEEYIEDYTCSNCQERTMIKKMYKIIFQPNILVISIKRFVYYPRIKKFNRRIIINTEDLDLLKYAYKTKKDAKNVSKSSNQVESNIIQSQKPINFIHKNLNLDNPDRMECTYKIRSYIEHSGNMNKGHYYSIIKQKVEDEEVWLCKNDDEVKIVKDHDNYLQGNNKNVYSLFYKINKKKL